MKQIIAVFNVPYLIREDFWTELRAIDKFAYKGTNFKDKKVRRYHQVEFIYPIEKIDEVKVLAQRYNIVIPLEN